MCNIFYIRLYFRDLVRNVLFSIHMLYAMLSLLCPCSKVTIDDYAIYFGFSGSQLYFIVDADSVVTV